MSLKSLIAFQKRDGHTYIYTYIYIYIYIQHLLPSLATLRDPMPRVKALGNNHHTEYKVSMIFKYIHNLYTRQCSLLKLRMDANAALISISISLYSHVLSGRAQTFLNGHEVRSREVKRWGAPTMWIRVSCKWWMEQLSRMTTGFWLVPLNSISWDKREDAQSHRIHLHQGSSSNNFNSWKSFSPRGVWCC